MKEQRCPKCNRKINLDKSFTILQKLENYYAKRYADKMMGKDKPKDMPEMKNYYCKCGLHITFIKNKSGGWQWVTAS